MHQPRRTRTGMTNRAICGRRKKIINTTWRSGPRRKRTWMEEPTATAMERSSYGEDESACRVEEGGAERRKFG